MCEISCNGITNLTDVISIVYNVMIQTLTSFLSSSTLEQFELHPSLFFTQNLESEYNDAYIELIFIAEGMREGLPYQLCTYCALCFNSK